MKKVILVITLISILAISFFVFSSKPSITGAVVGAPQNEKVIYLDSVANILNETKEILEEANSYTELAVESKITLLDYNEAIKDDLERIQGLKEKIYSMPVPVSYYNHHKSLKKEFDYYEIILQKLVENSTKKEIKILD